MLLNKSNQLTCFYDLAVSPCSYDFFSFLANVEICRKRRALNSIRLIFVKGPNKGFRQDNLRSDSQNKEFYLNVILPGLHMLESISHYYVCERDELEGLTIDPFNLYPRGYLIKKPTSDYLNGEKVISQIRGDRTARFSSLDFAQKIVKQKLDENKISKFITLTTREIERDDIGKTRSSNKVVWERVFEKFLKIGITPLVVRDTSKAFGKEKFIDEIEEFPEASLNPQVRLALYELSEMNFTKNNGPGFLQLFGNNRCGYFNKIDDAVHSLSTAWFEEGYGMSTKEASQYPMTTTNISFQWGDETTEAVFDVWERLREIPKNSIALHSYPGPKTQLLSFKVALTHLIKSVNYCVLEEDLLFLKKLSLKDTNGISINTLDYLSQFIGKGLRDNAINEIKKLASEKNIVFC